MLNLFFRFIKKGNIEPTKERFKVPRYLILKKPINTIIFLFRRQLAIIIMIN